MSAPKRIQRRRTKGWRMPEGAVSVSRPSLFGNPFIVGETYLWFGGSVWNDRRPFPIPTFREQGLYEHGLLVERPTDTFTVVRWFGDWAHAMVKADPDWLAPLRGHDLACWCPLDQPCHADVLLELANA